MEGPITPHLFQIPFQLTNGEFLQYSREAEGVSPWPGLSAPLPSPCPWTAVVAAVAAYGTSAVQPHLLGLSARHRLYRDGEEIAGDVTSFCLHSEFLLVTTLKHTLR